MGIGIVGGVVEDAMQQCNVCASSSGKCFDGNVNFASVDAPVNSTTGLPLAATLRRKGMLGDRGLRQS